MAWLEQHDGAVRIWHTQHQHLRAHRTDLSRRKVDDGDDQLAVQFVRTVVHRQLGAGAADAEWSKIDAKLVSRFSGFGKGLGLEDAANAHVEALEVRDINEGSLDQYA